MSEFKRKSVIKKERRATVKKEKTEGLYGWIAHLRYVRISPRKVRYIANEVRGKDYLSALAILSNMPNKGAFLLKKTVVSGAANAMNADKNLDEENLYLSKILVNEGPKMKRIWRRGRGKADTLLKRTSHISVVIDKKKGEE